MTIIRRVVFSAALALGAAPLPAAHAQLAGLSRTDAIRLAEAFRVSDALGDSLWPGWSSAPFPVLLVAQDREYLVRHPHPSSDFTTIGTDPILGVPVYSRPRSFPPNFQATFPAVGGVPTIVIGTAENTISRRSTRWVLTLLHEHFHQLQYSRADYYPRVAALGLQRGDSTGMWMLNFPFPYKTPAVRDDFAIVGQRLASALAARDSATFGNRLARYADAARNFRSRLTDDDARYLAFQLWQEGAARYTETRLAELASANAGQVSNAFRSLPDYTSYATERDTLLADIAHEIADEKLDVMGRVVVYNFGAAQALLLDRMSPRWRDQYFTHMFALGDDSRRR